MSSLLLVDFKKKKKFLVGGLSLVLFSIISRNCKSFIFSFKSKIYRGFNVINLLTWCNNIVSWGYISRVSCIYLQQEEFVEKYFFLESLKRDKLKWS